MARNWPPPVVVVRSLAVIWWRREMFCLAITTVMLPPPPRPPPPLPSVPPRTKTPAPASNATSRPTMMKSRPPPGRGRAAGAWDAKTKSPPKQMGPKERRHCSDANSHRRLFLRQIRNRLENVRAPSRGLSLKVLLRWGSVLAECGYDVREHVLDLVAHRKKDHDDHDRNEDEDQSVLNHALAFLTGRKTAELPVKTQHCIHLLFPELRTDIQLDGP